jgi:hypothetical protein
MHYIGTDGEGFPIWSDGTIASFLGRREMGRDKKNRVEKYQEEVARYKVLLAGLSAQNRERVAELSKEISETGRCTYKQAFERAYMHVLVFHTDMPEVLPGGDNDDDGDEI